MRHIYQSAERVLVWLGEECAEAITALTYVTNQSKLRSNNYDVLTSVGKVFMDDHPGMVPDLADGYVTEETSLQKRGKQQLAGFRNILGRSWWTRVWVIQEVVVNPNVTLVCGHLEVSWSAFTALIRGIYQSTALSESTEERAAYLQAIDRALSREQYATQTPQTMSELLLHHRGLCASDPRDNIFALLGIASDMSATTFSPD